MRTLVQEWIYGFVKGKYDCEEWAQSERCPMYKCAQKHQGQFYGLCKEFFLD